MIDMLPLSIGIGLAVGLIFSEVFGLAPGGMVVPGYIALYLTRPLDVGVTLVAALATFAIVHALASVVIIYGKRRTVLMILVGYLIGAILREILAGHTSLAPEDQFTVIGFIIPGLIAIWIDRQGILQTFSALVTASVVVRLILVIFVGAELQR
ncbi:MAG: poly-gamma-glutamate biosynthesis protein PgsC [Phycisphaerae bacterium]|mgnify:CR=1 FL=1|nr:poly-gamma-glutamate biosynthesis protein PgsC [Phycisphaerae bacterium]